MKPKYVQGDLFKERITSPEEFTKKHLAIPVSKLPSPYEPKVQNRWLTTFPIEFGIQQWTVSSTERPRVHNHPHRIDRIPIRFHDPIGPSTTQSLMKIYEGIIQKNTIGNDLSKFKDGFDYALELLDPTGITIEKWEIRGCKIETIDFGNLDYSSNNPLECVMWVQPTNIKLLY